MTTEPPRRLVYCPECGAVRFTDKERPLCLHKEYGINGVVGEVMVDLEWPK